MDEAMWIRYFFHRGMNMVKLNNGTEAPVEVVTTTMLSLREFAKTYGGKMSLHHLVQVCKGEKNKFSEWDRKQLQDASLVQTNGLPHELTRNIVLSAARGHFLDMKLVSPISEIKPEIGGK
jgi:hypothetical protein